MPACPVLRRRRSGRNHLGDHAQWSSQVRRRRRPGHGFSREICLFSVSICATHRRPQSPGGGARKSRGRSPRIGKGRSEEHTSELQSRRDLVCRLLLEKKKKKT